MEKILVTLLFIFIEENLGIYHPTCGEGGGSLFSAGVLSARGNKSRRNNGIPGFMPKVVN